MDLKSTLKTIIADFHARGIPEFVTRDVQIPLESGKIITLIGPRRAGKTYLLYETMARIDDLTNVLYLNFEDERLSFDSEHLNAILEAYFELYPNKHEDELFIFFDEIQETPGWERFVRRIYDTITRRIFITGSSAKVLSTEIASALRGRAITYEVYPLSLREYLRFSQIPEDLTSTKGRAKVMHAFERYIERGGFPETVLMDDETYRKTMKSYFDVMLYRDVIERHSIANPTIREFLKHLVTNTGKEFSVNRVYNDFTSRGFKVSKDSLYEYLSYFEDAFVVLTLENYAVSQRKRARKAYTIDTGLSRLFSLSEDRGRMLETIVFLELKRRGRSVHYHRNGAECDFIVSDEGVEAIQVCSELTEANEDREREGLANAMKRFKLDRGTIITVDVKREDRIRFVPIVDWLLSEP